LVPRCPTQVRWTCGFSVKVLGRQPPSNSKARL